VCTAIHSRGTGRLFVAILAIAALAGCRAEHASTAATLGVRLTDSSVELATPRVSAGRTRLTVTNDGPLTHEIVIARTSRVATDLPLEADGLAADQAHHDLSELREIETIQLHDTESLTVDLRPGHYVLFCNMAGHYPAGMTADLEVVP
jgi:uncharacterized cupredoxin-like copper-binding protein